ncbi:hypothetical protein [Methylotenera sp.]|uniref:hypothetical protein n=1 Tax=Methylotenera sp. TaxID=2051956 RepID=UPI00271DF2B4|nr:hypothetical protein [Methylotenera sp.]MDO9204411.1 hypothetical protein [Methylotenera sp.]MDP1523381.1 hypothetical protein [Methylotenera sp.]MDP2071858.1 hypothetical protein [Methylotenera sp.]MDP3819525.1 hypothetical protein [Methylotenera sp.]MDZ4212658.1 hypothetical protein [Methylotenera sp.]
MNGLRAYDILDSQPVIDFDTLTRLAANALNMPAAVIGLMDADRLWFKSELGLGVPQLDRQIAFCAYSIINPQELLIVEDLLLDYCFKVNPLVTQLEITQDKYRYLASVRAILIKVRDNTHNNLTGQRWVILSSYGVAYTLTARILSIFSITD